MGKLFWVSTVTLILLFSFVFAIVMIVLLYLDVVDVSIAIGATVVINLILWLIGPEITDWVNRFFYKVEFLPFDSFRAAHPQVAGMIEQVAAEYHFSIPKIGTIPDQNPTAFTYGSHRSNARIIVTEGLFTYLSEGEVTAVVAHELGHIVNRDFMVMMIGSTLVQILYELYASLSKSRGNGKGKGILRSIGLLAYVFYIIGIYLLYYLSRTREYLADRFAVSKTTAADLSQALIKIAYGIVAADDSTTTTRLLQSTRHLGVIDVKNARNVGIVSHLTKADPQVIAEVMAYDLISPWAFISELTSTHPLTGKRLQALAEMGGFRGETKVFEVLKATKMYVINKTKMWGLFYRDLLMMSLPWMAGIAAFLFLGIALIPALVGIALLLTLHYRYPSGKPKKTTLLSILRDPYTSPVRGIPVEFAGKVIGRGSPGFVLGEDLMFEDTTGLIYLNFISAAGFIGNLFFALKKVKALMGLNATASGWFYRGLTTSMTLARLETPTERISSHPKVWSVIVAVFLIGVSLFWLMI